MFAERFNDASLQQHLALVALQQGQGNADLVAELLKTVYVAYDLLDRNERPACTQHFARAQLAVTTAIAHAAATGDWRLAPEECENVKMILGLHDRQLRALPMHLIVAAKQRLLRVLDKGSFPSITA